MEEERNGDSGAAYVPPQDDAAAGERPQSGPAPEENGELPGGAPREAPGAGSADPSQDDELERRQEWLAVEDPDAPGEGDDADGPSEEE